MNTIALLLLSSVCAIAADDVPAVIVYKTNYSGAVATKEYFVRRGQTNLLISTTTTNGITKSQLHRFYHDRKRVADYLTAPKQGYVMFSTYNNGYSVSYESKSNVLQNVFVADKDGNFLDGFVITNGVLRPIPTGELHRWTGGRGPEKSESDRAE